LIRIELPFPVPLSACFTNAPGRGRVPTARYKAWQEEALWMIKAQRPVPMTGQVSIFIRLVAPDKRHRDAGNCDKACVDILVKAGLIKDDSNRYVRRLTYEWGEDGPGCVVLIQQAEQDLAA
jgi:crossover junction endodeoxyribonuclease RusA